MEKAYSRITWVNNMPPAINESNLNHIEAGLDTVDTRVVTLDTTKANISTVNTAIQSLTLDTETGIFTITKIDGTVLYLESSQGKIATNFTYDAQNQRLVLTLADGTTQYVDMSALITEYEFSDSNTISFVVASDGSISASVKNGSITDAMLESGYLATLTTLKTQTQGYRNEAHDYASNAEYDADLARSYAIGTNGEIRQGDATDNAKYYCEEAQRQGGALFYNSVSDFPAVGADNKLYVAKDTGYMYRYNTTSNTYVQVGGGGGGTIFYDSLSDFPAIGEEDTLYVAKDTNQMYRWRTAVNAYINVGGGDAENVTYWRQDYPDVSLALDALFGRTDLSYKVDDASDTTIDDADYVPFYDTSASAKKKITWSNIVAKIKTSLANYFGRKLSQASGVLKLLANDDTELSSVTLSPLATNTSYTDTNSIGANNVQSAIDTLASAPVLLCTLTANAPSQSGIDISPYKLLWFARRATNTNLWLCGDIGMAVPSFINNVLETYGRAYIQTFGDSVQERGWVSFNFSSNNTITLSWDDEDTPPTNSEFYVYGIK